MQPKIRGRLARVIHSLEPAQKRVSQFGQVSRPTCVRRNAVQECQRESRARHTFFVSRSDSADRWPTCFMIDEQHTPVILPAVQPSPGLQIRIHVDVAQVAELADAPG